MARKGKPKQVEESYDEYDSEGFSDEEDFVDKISDEDLLPDILSQKPKDSDVSQAVVIIDGLPEVGLDKVEKLRSHIKKLFKDCQGGVVSDHFPVNANNKTKGFALIELKNKAAAEEAVRQRHNHVLDKQHTLSCYLQTEMSKYTNVPDKLAPPQRQVYQDIGNLHYYLLDENCFDQFSVIHNPRNTGNLGNKTSIYLNSMPDPLLVDERHCWTESMCAWSPKGSYLTTMHSKGIALWGRDNFVQIQKFLHPGVQFIDFAPNEKYMVTYSPTADNHGDEPTAIIIFDVRTGLKKRAFHADRNMIWPILKWSHDDKYFARSGKDQLSVYETSTFGLVDKRSIKVDGIKEFSWSPTDNTVAYWIGENNEVPAKVALMTLPNKEEIRFKNLFNVAHCKIHWQKSGDYLCVRVARYTKAKRDKNEVKYSGIYYSLEIFHMRERGIPVDSIEIKENILSFDWEPTGNMFGVISGEYPHINVTFYQVAKGVAPVEMKRYEKCPYNAMFWSPRGQFVVLAGLKELNGAIQFIDTQNFTVMQSSEHFMVTDVEWDPTGRYVATIVSWWGHKVDNAYWLWSFQGKCLRKVPLDELCQFIWRPRPPSPISAADIREIKKKMKKYAATFDLQDQMRSNKASQDIIDTRRGYLEEFSLCLACNKKAMEEEKEQRDSLRDGGAAEDEMEVVMEVSIKTESSVVN